MSNLPADPVGFYVLIEMVPVTFKSKGGILLYTDKEGERERKGRVLAKILAFGPIAYNGFSGCKSHKDWGVEVGDTVELKERYGGTSSALVELDLKYGNFQYVPDSEIIGKFSAETVKQLINEDK